MLAFFFVRILKQQLDHFIEVVELVLIVEVIRETRFDQTLELNAAIQLTLILEAPVTDHIKWLRKIVFQVFLECFPCLENN
jgi:hypothetical protein